MRHTITIESSELTLMVVGLVMLSEELKKNEGKQEGSKHYSERAERLRDKMIYLMCSEDETEDAKTRNTI